MLPSVCKFDHGTLYFDIYKLYWKRMVSLHKQHFFDHKSHLSVAVARGFLSTRITESPRRNILLIYRSLLTGFAFFVPFPDFGNSVHISFTFSSTILQCRSNALTRPNNFLLFRQLIRTCVLLRTDSVRMDSGPVLNSSSSSRESSSGVISDFGLAVAMFFR